MTIHAHEIPAGLAKCRAIIRDGEQADAIAVEWSGMDRREREFWLHYARLPAAYAERFWRDIPGAARATLKNNLFRAAKRAAAILHSSQDNAPRSGRVDR